MEVHDGIVVPLVPVDHGVGVEADDDVVALLGALLEEVEVADVEEVEGARHVDDAVAGARGATVGELQDLLRRGEELVDPGPRAVGVRPQTELSRGLGFRNLFVSENGT